MPMFTITPLTKFVIPAIGFIIYGPDSRRCMLSCELGMPAYTFEGVYVTAFAWGVGRICLCRVIINVNYFL